MCVFRTFICLIYCFFYLLFISPRILVVNKLIEKGDPLSLEKKDRIIKSTVKKFGQNVNAVAGVKVIINGAENIPKTPVVFVGNHESYFDILAMLATLDEPVGFMAKIELYKIPLLRTWMKYINCVSIDRNNIRQSMSALNEATALLENGKSIIVFPEGTRKSGEEIGEFKEGAFRMALKSHSPILPFAIDGSYKIMGQQGFWIKPGTIRLTYLPAIETAGISKERAKLIGEEIRNLIIEQKNRNQN